MNNTLSNYLNDTDESSNDRRPRKKRCTKTQKQAKRKALKLARKNNR
ncbi:hypothetical protein [Endozoicomonas sp.]